MDPAELPSPALVVDMGAFAANVAAADRWCGGTTKRLRPHVKTHRTPALALIQLTPMTSGLTCATVGEAEAMAQAGAGDILLANELAGRGKLGRKSIAGDYGPPAPLIGGCEVVGFHEEHTMLRFASPGAAPPRLGERVALRPRHVRLTFNLHDVVWLAQPDGPCERVPVAARGRSW